MNNKKKKELSKFQKTLAIIGLILCAAGAIFGFSQGMRMSVFFPPMNTAVRYILSTLFVTYFFAGFYFRPDQKFSELPLPASLFSAPRGTSCFLFRFQICSDNIIPYKGIYTIDNLISL